MLKEKVSQSSKNLIVSKVFFIHIFIKLSSCFFSTEININFTVTFKAFNFPVWFFKNILLWLLLPWKAPYSRMDEPPHIASFLQGAYWLETLTQSLKNFSIVFEARFSSESSETSHHFDNYLHKFMYLQQIFQKDALQHATVILWKSDT